MSNHSQKYNICDTLHSNTKIFANFWVSSGDLLQTQEFVYLVYWAKFWGFSLYFNYIKLYKFNPCIIFHHLRFYFHKYYVCDFIEMECWVPYLPGDFIFQSVCSHRWPSVISLCEQKTITFDIDDWSCEEKE